MVSMDGKDTRSNWEMRRRLSVAAAAARFLEIRLRAVRQVVVHHETHVRFVDTHPESIGADHDTRLSPLPRFLPLRPLEVAQSGMVERGRDSLR